jgi:hypothetical protein
VAGVSRWIPERAPALPLRIEDGGMAVRRSDRMAAGQLVRIALPHFHSITRRHGQTLHEHGVRAAFSHRSLHTSASDWTGNTAEAQMNERFVINALAAAALAVSSVGASAAQVQPKIAVPSPGPAGIQGCWSADRMLYGPYQLTFCVDRFGGSYQVTGGGLNCRAELTWWKGWNGYRFAMERAKCGRGTDWTADSFVCEVKYEPVYSGRSADEDDSGFEPKIAVPSPDPSVAKLDCRYKPSVLGYPSRRFAAYRD